MTIKSYVESLFESGIQIFFIRIGADFGFYDSILPVTMSNGTNIEIGILRQPVEDASVVEFLDRDKVTIAKAKGFDSMV